MAVSYENEYLLSIQPLHTNIHFLNEQPSHFNIGLTVTTNLNIVLKNWHTHWRDIEPIGPILYQHFNYSSGLEVPGFKLFETLYDTRCYCAVLWAVKDPDPANVSVSELGDNFSTNPIIFPCRCWKQQQLQRRASGLSWWISEKDKRKRLHPLVFRFQHTRSTVMFIKL